MVIEEIRGQLFANKDEEYQKFQSKLIPNIPAESVIGVRTPVLRQMAKNLGKHPEIEEFLNDLPHKYYEENNLHGFIICNIKDFETCIDRWNAFLSYVDNWATCDQSTAKVMQKNTEKLLPIIKKWLASGEVYTVRFAINCLMRFYLDDKFEIEYLDLVSGVENPDYYVKMVVAWYFATALAKQYDATIPYIEKRVLPEWTHKKTIQKAIESYRITPEQKDYLRSLR